MLLNFPRCTLRLGSYTGNAHLPPIRLIKTFAISMTISQNGDPPQPKLQQQRASIFELWTRPGANDPRADNPNGSRKTKRSSTSMAKTSGLQTPGRRRPGFNSRWFAGSDASSTAPGWVPPPALTGQLFRYNGGLPRRAIEPGLKPGNRTPWGWDEGLRRPLTWSLTFGRKEKGKNWFWPIPERQNGRCRNRRSNRSGNPPATIPKKASRLGHRYQPLTVKLVGARRHRNAWGTVAGDGPLIGFGRSPTYVPTGDRKITFDVSITMRTGVSPSNRFPFGSTWGYPARPTRAGRLSKRCSPFWSSVLKRGGSRSTTPPATFAGQPAPPR